MPDSKKTNTSLLRPPRQESHSSASVSAQRGGNGRWGHVPPTASPAPSTRCRCWKPVHKVLAAGIRTQRPPSTSATIPRAQPCYRIYKIIVSSFYGVQLTYITV